jgi:hypothetical protein
MLIISLLHLRDRKGDIKMIKSKLNELFGQQIRNQFSDKTRSSSNLADWEKNILKIFSRYKTTFVKTKALY